MFKILINHKVEIYPSRKTALERKFTKEENLKVNGLRALFFFSLVQIESKFSVDNIFVLASKWKNY